MAFSDISRWAKIMEAQENEKRAYDEACERNEAETAELDRKEMENLDEDEIDAGTFAETEAEHKAELADVEEEDDEIDFGAYGVDDVQVPPPALIDEADRREPLTAIAAALGKIVSTATLDGENSTKLVEELNPLLFSRRFMTVDEAKKLVEDAAREAGDVCVTAWSGVRAAPFDVKAEGNAVKFFAGAKTRMGFDEFVEKISNQGLRWRDVADITFAGTEGGSPAKLLRVVKTPRGQADFDLAFCFESPRPAGRYGDFFDGGNGEEPAQIEEADGRDGATDEGWLAWAGGEKKVAGWSDADKTKSRELFDDLVAKGKVDGATGKPLGRRVLPDFPRPEGAPPPPAAAVDRTDEMKDDPDYPLTDEDWDEIDSLDSVKDKITAIKSLVGYDTLNPNAKKQIDADIDFLEGVARQQEASEKWFRRAAAIQKASWRRALTQKEIEEFADILNTKLDDFQKTVLLDVPFREGYYETFATRVPKGGEQGGHGAFHRGEDADERTAETGLDQSFTAENWLNMQEPMTPGEKIEIAFDPKYVSRSDQLADLAKDVRDVSRVTKPYYRNTIDRDRKAAAARRIAVGKGPAAAYVRGQPGRTLSKDAWKFVRDQVDQGDLDQIKAEVMRGAGTQSERDFADWMFGDLKVTQKMNAAVQGMGGEQGGDTGANTQQGTKMQDFILAQLALYLNVSREEADRMLNVYRSESVVPGADQGAAGGARYVTRSGAASTLRKKSDIDAALAAGEIFPNPKSARMVREQLRGVLFREILDEEGFTPEQAASVLGLETTPDPNGTVPQMKAAGLVIGFILQKALAEMSPSEFQEFKTAFGSYQTKAEVRKFRTGLNDQQNAEYQDIIHMMRRDFDSVPEDKKRRFAVLDGMRRGQEAAQAEAYVDRMLDAMGGDRRMIDDFFRETAERFLKGGSGNARKAKIDVGTRDGEEQR